MTPGGVWLRDVKEKAVPDFEMSATLWILTPYVMSVTWQDFTVFPFLTHDFPVSAAVSEFWFWDRDTSEVDPPVKSEMEKQRIF
jgi:hypothetical protein